MKYTNDTVRRQDRLLDEASARQLLCEAEYGVLSMATPEGGAYGIPVNYVYDGSDTLYIHCAPEGRKLRCIEANERVSFCVVGRTRLLPGKFTTEYESVVVEGRASVGLSDEEKRHAIALLLDKLDAAHKAEGLRAAEHSYHRLEVVKVEISTFSGKCKRVMPTKP